eukprot:gb/GECH01011581.1/.p1 GENE.gb/GECH01011581.1/~~gb/GECH01011581.1/.p1  ORF type:complete len:442 (+),score=151.39 gb/GECH01011581.1/:1-1326(+)
MNSNATQTQSFINIKVYYDNLPDVRRLRFSSSNLNLEELKRQVTPKDGSEFRIAYKDTEGDWVNIQSNEELHDAVYFYKDASDPLLRLKVFPHGSNTNSKPKPSPENPFAFGGNFPSDIQDSVEHIVNNLQNAASQNPILSDFMNNFSRAMEHQKQKDQSKQKESVPQENSSRQPNYQPYPGENRLNHNNNNNTQARSGLSRIFHPLFQFTKNDDNENDQYLSGVLIHQAVGLMNENDLNGAESKLLKAKELKANAELAYYNLACIESQRGNVENAVDYLKEAVNNGYKNTEWMLKDPDLANIRTLHSFHELIANIGASKNEDKSDSPFADAPKTTTPEQQEQASTEEAKADGTLEANWDFFHTSQEMQQEQPETNNFNPYTPETEEPSQQDQQLQQDQEKWADQLQILHEMGLKNDELNINLLNRWNGNLARVINEALAQ